MKKLDREGEARIPATPTPTPTPLDPQMNLFHGCLHISSGEGGHSIFANFSRKKAMKLRSSTGNDAVQQNVKGGNSPVIETGIRITFCVYRGF